MTVMSVDSIVSIPVDRIKEAKNVRKESDKKSLEELAKSIKKQGLLQPITVIRREDHCEVLFGHRRFRAYQLLAAEDAVSYGSMPCIVKEKVDEEQIVEIQLIENIQRENISASDLKDSLIHLKDKGYTHRQIANKLGKSPGYIRNIFTSINTLSNNADLEELVNQNEHITIADIQEVTKLSKAMQLKLIKLRAEGKIKTTKELREKVKEYNAKREASAERTPESRGLSVDTFITSDKDSISFRPMKIELSSLQLEERQQLKSNLLKIVDLL